MLKNFKLSMLSLRVRIFLSMIVLIIVASILLASISIIQFKNEAKEYHQERLERKENAVKEHINYVLSTTTYPLTTENLDLIFKDKIHELAQIHNIEINIYGLDGKLLKSSKESFSVDKVSPSIPKYILKLVRSSIEKRYVDIKTINGVKNRSSFTQIKDDRFKPLGVLNLPYLEDDGFYEKELSSFLIRLGQVYSFMLLVAFALAYFLSSYITKSLKTISDKLNETSLNQKNEKINLEANSKEINLLIKAYNQMVDELEKSAVKLAQSEREEAWREMAKQVAHEIKNPLTPMRLTVQSFQRRFSPEDPNINQKMKDYSETLIQQIDTMSAVASAFSNFASMPAQQNETLNVVEVVELALDIFNENNILFEKEAATIISKIDRTQLVRIITNLVKNAIQSIPEIQEYKRIRVAVKKEQNNVLIIVEDNGVGINPMDVNRIFQPKFTTKNSGMGLGLGIIKNIIENYKGTITFETEYGQGTRFTVSLPIINS
jgi:two-component system nitrogen regulation sensor histidine kinase NtrY